MFELIFVESLEKYGVVVARKTLKINGQKKQFIQINFDNQVDNEYRLSKCDWFDNNLNKVNFVVADDYEFIKSADIAFKDFTTTKFFDNAFLYSDISIAQNVARTFKMNLLAIPVSVRKKSWSVLIMNDKIQIIDNVLKRYKKDRKSLEEVLSECTGKIDVKFFDYDNEDGPDIYFYENITKSEVYTLNNDLTNDLGMQVYHNDQLVYSEGV